MSRLRVDNITSEQGSNINVTSNYLGKRIFYFVVLMSVLLMSQNIEASSLFGLKKDNLLMSKELATSNSIVKYFTPAFQSYKQSYRPTVMTIASMILRGIKESRIYGGTQASTHEYPFLVSIQTSNRQHYCGGSLIAPNFVLSAAHCFVTGTTVDNPTTVYILPGTNDRTCSSCTRYRGKTITVHPGYDEQTTRNDIAILELQSSIPVDGTSVKLASVEGGSYPIDGSKSLIVSGWGYTVGTSLPTMLMKTSVVVNPVSVCLFLDMITPNQICAGGNGHDSCAGDSGGPLFRVDSSNNFIVLGIVSYGDDGCGTFTNKGVYTNTTYYLPFIKSVVPSVGVLPQPGNNPTPNPVNNSTNSTTSTNSTSSVNSTITISSNNTLSNSTISSGNYSLSNSTNNSTVSNSSIIPNLNSTDNLNNSIPLPTPTPIPSPPVPSSSTPHLSNSSSNSSQWYNGTVGNSTKNGTTTTGPNSSNIASPYFHFIISTLIMLFISTCFNNLVTI